jgi:radical SAM superfamily enzyme YgiQ (UPF0313 family)
VAKILLVSANPAREPYPVFPLGLACIAGATQAAGHTIRQWDFLASEETPESLLATVREFLPDVIGLSLRNIDSTDSTHSTQYLDTAAALVALLRQEATAAGGRTVPIVLGGAAFSLAPKTILAKVGADYGIVGEGELLFPRLVDALRAGERPERIQRVEPQSLLDAFPPLLVDEDIARFYYDESGLANLQSKRGCPYRCAYCSYPALEGRTYRYRSPERVLEDIERLKREHKASQLFITDSVFNDAAGRWRELAELLASRGAPLPWAGYFRPQGLTREDLRLLKSSGLTAMELGTDATTDATLAGLDKGFSFAEALAFHQSCRAENIPVAHFVIFGGPGETMETLEQGLANLTLLKDAPVFVYSGVRVLPSTTMAKLCASMGNGEIDESALLDPVYYFSPGVDPKAMNARIEAAFKGDRLRLFPPVEAQARFNVMRRFGFKGLLWDRLIG